MKTCFGKIDRKNNLRKLRFARFFICLTVKGGVHLLQVRPEAYQNDPEPSTNQFNPLAQL